jgi:dihydrodipicolinate synthase/N-acetylneuraminate lyase
MFSGLMPAMVTPFDERGEVDLRATKAVIEWFIEAGVSGISSLGNTSEFWHLLGEERKLFVDEVVRIVAGRVPLAVVVGAAGAKEMVELARHAESVGADAVLVVSTFLLQGGREGPFQVLRGRGRLGRHIRRDLQPPDADRHRPLALPDR